jgi:hypothetical protein
MVEFRYVAFRVESDMAFSPLAECDAGYSSDFGLR